MSDIDIRMHVRRTSIVPDERWTFNSPDIPGLVAADIFLLIEGHVQLIDAARFLQDLHDFVDILFAIRSQENAERFFHELFLIGLQFRHLNTGELTAFALDLHRSFSRGFFQQSFRRLLRSQRLEHSIGLLSLVEVNIL